MASRWAVVLALVATICTLTQGTQVHLECGEHEQLPELGNWIRNVGERTSWHDARDLPASIAGNGGDGKWASFERPLPNMLDRSFLDRAEDTFNHDQSFVPPSKCADEHCNDFVLEGRPFVVALDNAYVGHDGLVFDSSYVYPTRGIRKWHEPHWQMKDEADVAAAKAKHVGDVGRFGHAHRPLMAAGTVICVDKLVTILQPYQENYYHFVAESLPRLIMAKDILLQDPSVRLLTRAQPFIIQFLAKLGIPADRIETLNQGEFIHANTLYVPTPTKIFAPPQENLLALYQHFAVNPPVQGPRNLVVYTSREGAWSREVENEKDLLEAMRALLAKTDLELAVFDGSSLGVEETISLFQRAIMVIGPHGAGLTNMLWTREATKVVEFLHMSYPLLCYWHMASALGLEYWMLPVPESSWAGNMVLPVQEVLDIMLASLKAHFSPEHDDDTTDPVVEPCAPGTAIDAAAGGCTPCPPGTFSYHHNSEVCTACVPGQFASGSGNTHCSMCPPGSYSAQPSASACTECPPATDPQEPNAQVVWGSKSQDTCPARLRPDDARFGSHTYAVADNNSNNQVPHHHTSMVSCCVHWIVGLVIFASLLFWILR